jgi:hypothetical protein
MRVAIFIDFASYGSVSVARFIDIASYESVRVA